MIGPSGGSFREFRERGAQGAEECVILFGRADGDPQAFGEAGPT
jgi:hypothetical protein